MKALPFSRVFYGWWVAIALLVVMAFSQGIGYYIIPVMLPPLTAEFGWSRTAVSGLASVFLLVLGVLSPLAGRLCDRFGSKRVMLLSVPVFGAGLALLSLTQALWQLYAIYALFSIAAVGLHTVPASTAITRWFVCRRGTAMGVALTGMNLGGLLVAPFAAYWNAALGWRATFVILGILSWLVLLPLISLVVRSGPEERGLTPDGKPPQAKAPKREEIPQPRVLRSPAFWLITLSFFLVNGAFVGTLTHQVFFLTDAGMPALTAAAVLGFTAGFGIAGKLVVGFLGDRMSKTLLTGIVFGLQGVGLLILMTGVNVTTLWLFAVLFGLGVGATPVMRPLVITNFFGSAPFGATYGWFIFFSYFGSALGAPFAGYIYDSRGSYSAAFAIFLVAYLASVLCLFLAQRLHRPQSLRATSPPC